MMILLASVIARRAWKSLPVRSEKPRCDVNAVSLTILIFGLVDWLLIASLPRLGLSFEPTLPALLLILLARLVIFACIGLFWDFGRRFASCMRQIFMSRGRPNAKSNCSPWRVS